MQVPISWGELPFGALAKRLLVFCDCLLPSPLGPLQLFGILPDSYMGFVRACSVLVPAGHAPPSFHGPSK